MNDNFELKQIKCIEGLYYSFALLELNYTSLYEKCVAIKSNPENVINALSQCWFIVDLVHRIRELSRSTPGLSRSNINLKNFLKQTEIAEKYRHYIQHLRQELSKEEINSYPVWGTLSWVDPVDNNNSFIAIIGSRIQQTEYPGCVYNVQTGKWVSKVSLSIGNMSFNFDTIYNYTITFRDFITSWIKNNYKTRVVLPKDTPILSVKIIHKK